MVTVGMNPITGRESYAVDGVEVLRTYSPWGNRRIVVGKTERHLVTFRIAWYQRVSVEVDGQTLTTNLVPELYRFTLVATLLSVSLVLVGMILVLFTGRL